MTFPPIAIVGRSCVLPGALSPGALWERVLEGADLVSRAPPGRWRLRHELVCGDAVSGVDTVWTDRGGYVEGFDSVFDPSGFALPAEQVQTLDPLVRWLLHISREALREAGVEGGPRVAAVFGNLSFPSAAFARFAEHSWLGSSLATAAGVGPVDARNRFMSGLPVHLVARALGLGPAFALDAACASSLYAIKLACDLLHDRQVDVALAGAVNAADDLFIHIGFTALQALSRSGRSRPFHREADGLLPAEGAGAVTLKRLEDAQVAGDRIFGVIRGIGLSNDGRGRGLLAPSEEGQERAMRAAYAAAGLLPADVSLLECHATGTAVGDAVEVRSTARVFAGAADVPIGSLKSNFGHAVTAAGIAGLLKVIGAMAAGVRPPTLHADDPLALLDGTPLRLLRAAEAWECRGVRRGAVSAFGFGGANAHLIVEEPGDCVRASGFGRGETPALHGHVKVPSTDPYFVFDSRKIPLFPPLAKGEQGGFAEQQISNLSPQPVGDIPAAPPIDLEHDTNPLNNTAHVPLKAVIPGLTRNPEDREIPWIPDEDFGNDGNNCCSVNPPPKPVGDIPCAPPLRTVQSPGVSVVVGQVSNLSPEHAVAVVGIGAAVGMGRTAADFAAALFAAAAPATHCAATISLPVVGTRFPPNDLAAALPQQIWTMAAAREALAGITLPPPELAGVMIGMGCDPAVARYGARWRLPDIAAAWGVTDEAWIRRAADVLSPALAGAGVLGTMPNLTANRLNVQFDLAGPGFTISAEELSGVRALQVGLRALRAGELDLVLAGAADFSCDPVHEAALRELGLPGPSGDGAVVIALKRLSDARRDGDRVLALIDAVVDIGVTDEPTFAAAEDFGDSEVAARFGRAHAAFGLVRILAAVVACAAGRLPGGAHWSGERRVDLDIRALGGQRVHVGVRAAETSAVEFPVTAVGGYPLQSSGPSNPPLPLCQRGNKGDLTSMVPGELRKLSCNLSEVDTHAAVIAAPAVAYQAHRAAPLLPPLPVMPITLKQAPVLAPVVVDADPGVEEPAVLIRTSGSCRCAPPVPPALRHPFLKGLCRQLRSRQIPLFPPLTKGDQGGFPCELLYSDGGEDSSMAATMPHAPRLADMDEYVRGVPVVPPSSSPPTEHAGIHTHEALAQIAAQVALAARVHRAFLEDQAAAHRQFLEFRERASATLLAASTGGVTQQLPADALPLPADARELVSPRDEIGEGVARRGGLQRRSEAKPMEVRSDRTPQLGRETAGIVFDRCALEIHANGQISQIFGSEFADQDALRRRVRMPEPPLLLTDRVVRLEARPLSLGTGAIWTETDISPGAWYLHDNRMPAGIMVEAGQSDLLLVSWLGVDALNRGERVYRLLGCELTYHGGLPVAGETLRYEIGIDGHSQQGAVRLFFFHSTCTVAGIPRLTVRGGQAGFFSDEELAGSAGVLWDPASLERRDEAQVDPPLVSAGRVRLSREQLDAFAAGRADECFGPGFEVAATHTRTPHLPGGRLLLLEEVTEIAVGGGPWGRGYLRAVDRIDPVDWFFAGHFTNDPCMPGTLMFEGGLQAMAVYLAALGFTLERDGWRFEPVPDEPYTMRCRGQVTPASRELVYEIFVEELIAGPEPTLFADILCTVDGLKAFHCRRMGLRLVPGWPLDSKRELLDGIVEEGAAASAGDLRYDERSLLACAWGRPSAAFGPAYRAFDGVRKLARLPGPPYQFMSRVTRLEGEMGAMREGSAVEVEYDIPFDAWYFAANGARTMPFAVLLEAALQPCGWLATWAGSPLTTEQDLSFRNLDGDGCLLAEVFPDDGRLRTRAVLTRISRSAGMLIESFAVSCSVGERPVYELKTVFGYFPAAALARQVGLPALAGEREALDTVCAESIDLHTWRKRMAGEGPRLAVAPLLMLDRVTGIWPAGGPAGRGRYRAETDIDPAAWFFKAHFFQDPVQPGSLGLEAMLQLLQFAMIYAGMAGSAGKAARFEPLALGEPHTWKYRGQVLPSHRRVITLLDLVRTGEDDRGPLAVADASLWVDGTKIYEACGLAMRIARDTTRVVAGLDVGPCTSGAGTSLSSGSTGKGPVDESHLDPPIALGEGEGFAADDEEVLDPVVDTWLQDHRPTWTVPALPLMSMIDRLARAAVRGAPGMKVVAVQDARALRWVPVTGPLRLKTQVVPEGAGIFNVTLLSWRVAATGALSRFEAVATGRVCLAPDRALGTDLKSVHTGEEDALGEGVARRGGLQRRTEGSTMEVRSDRTPQPAREQRTPDAPWDPPPDASPAPDPYESGTLFHGPSFQLLRSLTLAPGASSSLLDAAGGGEPRGLLHEALLDALTHGIPHDRLCDWSPEIPADHVAYPHRIVSLRLFAALPGAGEVRCETRFVGFDGESRFPRFHVQAIAGGRVIASLDLVEVLFPKGALGSAPPRDRRAFLRDHRFVPGLRLSSEESGTTHLAEVDVRASDWLPGTLTQAYAVDEDLLGQIAVKEHAAARFAVHPSTVAVDMPLDPARSESHGAGSSVVFAHCPAEPLTVRPLTVDHTVGSVSVRDAGPPTLDFSPVRDWWDSYYRIGRWPVEDIYFGLAGRFVRRVRLEDPAGFAALRGRGVLYLANHQVGIESILFSVIASGLSGILTVTLAKIEHRTTWLGNLIRHAFAWPGAHDPGVITYFDRSNREELPRIIGVLAQEIAGGGKSVMVHVEGTRAFTCRAPVQKMSGAFIDMAIATGAPVVPVRFAGGLPVESLAAKLEYPVGMGGQEITIGAAIPPAELAALPYKERKERVIDAINGLGPAASEEVPLQPDPGFAAAVREWASGTGASPEHAALFEVLRRLGTPVEEIALLLAGARAGHLKLRDDTRGRWLAELARRLYGPRGPGVTLAG